MSGTGQERADAAVHSFRLRDQRRREQLAGVIAAISANQSQPKRSAEESAQLMTRLAKLQTRRSAPQQAN